MNAPLRIVEVFERRWPTGKVGGELVSSGMAAFHGFGSELDGEENVSVAIVEMSDGQVHTVHPTHIVFQSPTISKVAA